MKSYSPQRCHMFISFLFVIVFFFSLIPSGIIQAEASTVTSRVLGTNIGSNADWSSAIMFQDVFKSSRAWTPQSNSEWDTGEYALLDLDADGWVKSLPASDSPLKYRWVMSLFFQNLGGHYPTGQYTVLYDGEGTIDYFNAGCYPNADCVQKNITLSHPGRDVLDVNRTNDYGIQLRIRSTDPNKTGNYIRNIRMILPGHENSYQSDIFNPPFLDQIKPYGVLRFMEAAMTNNSKESKWQERAKPSDYTWTTDK